LERTGQCQAEPDNGQPQDYARSERTDKEAPYGGAPVRPGAAIQTRGTSNMFLRSPQVRRFCRADRHLRDRRILAAEPGRAGRVDTAIGETDGERTRCRGVADQVESRPALQIGARVGYAANGVLHLLTAWIALQVAWTASGKSADQSGALQTLAGSSPGRLTLWVAVAGFLALGLWQLANALAVRTGGESSKLSTKAKGVAKAALYFVLAWTSLGFANGKPSSSKAQRADFTATLLQHAGGRLLVAVIGVVIIGVGGYHVMKGWTKKFLQDLSENPGILATRAGVVGYIAKGVALAVVGVLFVTAAVQNSPSKATGLDGALRSLRQQTVGPWLLTAVALGIAAYGVYSFARSRHARV